MPAGSPWVTHPVPLGRMAPGRYWHAFDEAYGPLAANPMSQGRLALPAPLGKFYVASSAIGALWEVALRFGGPDAHGYVRIDTTKLAGKRIVELELLREDVPMLDLRQPARRHLFPLGSPPCLAIDGLLREPRTPRTHGEAIAMRDDLRAAGVDDMPVVAWPSRQISTESVFLFHQPPMQAAWWRAGTPIALDDHDGYAWLAGELRRHGFRWSPLGSLDTPAGPE